MPQVKEKSKNKKKTVSEKRIEDGADESAPIDILLGKKPISIDEPESLLPQEEKTIDEEIVAPTVDEDEEVTLDDEEVNPFGDKWEE